MAMTRRLRSFAPQEITNIHPFTSGNKALSKLSLCFSWLLSMSAALTETFPIHRLVFANDAAGITKAAAALAGASPPPPSSTSSQQSPPGSSFSSSSSSSSRSPLNSLCRGQTPLTLAISLGHADCVRALLEAGASTIIKNAAGWTAFQEATSYGNRDVMELIYRCRRKELASWLRSTGTNVLKNLARDLGDFYVEMSWSFGSYVPFVSTLCPSDTYKVFKKGRSVRIDTTLVGFESLSWIRGDVSIIFTQDSPVKKKTGDAAEPASSRLVICDHQRRLVQQLYPRDFSIGDDQVQEELSVSLNTKMVTPPSFDFTSFAASRTQSGFWTFKVDRNERVGPWETCVWSVDALECTTRIRREHLLANPPPPVIEDDLKKKDELSDDDERSDQEQKRKKKQEEDQAKEEEVDEDELIRRYDAGLWSRELGDQVATREASKKAFRELAQFRPTLDPPQPPSITAEEFFSPDAAGTFLHVGRPIVEESETKTYKATLWMYDEDSPITIEAFPQREPEESILKRDAAAAEAYTYFPTIVQATPTPPPSIRSKDFPLKIQTLLPLLELAGVGGGDHVAALREFLNVQLPPGFPVQIEIPVGVLPLTARLTFQNISTTYPIDDGMFAIPGKKEGYRAGEVIDGSDGSL
ncbi:Ankyrin repeat domain-containing protein 13C [Geranomyces michiganensis]|nr:Ankyrin repeat domain-containing protein 13C [Geranomyces michiganensis]